VPRIIVLTGYGSIPAAVDAVKHGAIDFRTKPTTPEEIVTAMRNALSQPLPATQLEDVERQHIRRALAGTDGNISLAARRLGLHRRTLQRKLQRLDGQKDAEGDVDENEPIERGDE
jgi:two-component system response regulator RegA